LSVPNVSLTPPPRAIVPPLSVTAALLLTCSLAEIKSVAFVATVTETVFLAALPDEALSVRVP